MSFFYFHRSCSKFELQYQLNAFENGPFFQLYTHIFIHVNPVMKRRERGREGDVKMKIEIELIQKQPPYFITHLFTESQIYCIAISFGCTSISLCCILLFFYINFLNISSSFVSFQFDNNSGKISLTYMTLFTHYEMKWNKISMQKTANRFSCLCLAVVFFDEKWISKRKSFVCEWNIHFNRCAFFSLFQ